ncbi:hypothetical protein EJ065_2732 [Corallococcus coralloides]|uniref:Restriction endonuclease type IV Mrr domain-containing protein n=1 Tax=Corallococcus coralloides TaxID=184914 RepID=A0A410RQX3_CORCK|nr:hypothetical protein [Corallococcus coralloides]QAT84304.1 hypothetical protein EJ065_2732 [Corallococcus coralloides]
MLAAAFASWIEQIPERAFDATFLDLLRAQGFYDIHFTHGPYEFGKDFIAKRDEPTPIQYAFQGKAGDIGGSAWRELYSQLLELSSDGPAHPGFDANLPRKSVLVTTGRLTGKATVGPSQLQAYLSKASLGKFEVWDSDVLKELLNGSSRFSVAPSPTLLPILGHVEADTSTERILERELALLIPPAGASLSSVRRALVDNSLVVARLADKNRPFLALHSALNGIRIAAARAHENLLEGSGLIRDALDSYTSMGMNLLEPLLEAPANPATWMRWVGGPSRMITYPVACAKVLEFLGLAVLHHKHQGRKDKASNLAMVAARIVDDQPGAAHPISDRFAVSYPPALAALVHFGHQEQATRLVRETTKWVCDRYEASPFGLAGPYADPDEEVRTLLGATFEFINLKQRRTSMLAVALADASYSLSLPDYPNVVNDVLAVQIVPSCLHPDDRPDSYIVGGAGTSPLINIHYPEALGTKPLRHHALQATPRIPEQAGGPATPLALACITRDRLFTDVLARL